MADRHDDLTPPPADDGPVAESGEVPLLSGLFKAPPEGADTDSVNESIGGRPRLNWSPVTDTGGGRRPPDRESTPSHGFKFDLGAAMARFGGQPADSEVAGATADADASAEPAASETPASARPPAAGEAESDDPPAPLPAAPPRSTDAPQMVEIPEPPTQPIRPYAERHRGPGQVFNLAAAIAEQQKSAVPPPLPRTEMRVRPIEPERSPYERHDQPDPPSLPRRGAPTATGPTGRAEPAPTPASQRPAAEQPSRPNVPSSRSVFEDASQAVLPTLPSGRGNFPPAPPTPPAESVAGTLQPGSGIPVLPSVPNLPTLPPVAPAAPPPMVTAAASSIPDVQAVRTAQIRAKRQQRRGGRLFGRAILILLALGLLVMSVLTFGRSRLFPDAWDPALTPLVDEIQQQHGIEFDDPVPLTRQASAEYAGTVSRLLLGDDWIDRVPEWRALGLTGGDPTLAEVGTAIAGRRLAVYDADANRIFMLEGADAAAASPDLRTALEAAFAAQVGRRVPAATGNGLALTGVSSAELLAQRAVSAYVANASTTAGTADDGRVAQPAAASAEQVIALPLPIEYEITAVDALGQPLLAAAHLDPAMLGFGADLPADLGQRLDDGAAVTSAGVLQQGERALAEPVALGVDDWSLVWSTRLTRGTVAALVDRVGADSYRPVDRSGITCAVGVFETASASDAASVSAALATWVAAGPAQSQASVAPLSETRVQLVTCDPGVNAAVAPQATGVTDLIERQIARLER